MAFNSEFFERKVRDERLFQLLPLTLTILAIVSLASIIATLLYESIPFFSRVDIGEFLFGFEWTPLFRDKKFGVLPLLWGTTVTALVAISVSGVLGLGSAIYISEYSSPRIRNILKPLMEFLAGIPTVVYGFFAVSYVTPFLRTFIPEVDVYNAFSAGVVMGIMITPIISSISEDALYSVPDSLRLSAYSLGARKSQVVVKIVFRAALPGIVSAYILGFARAIGETMIVAIAAGSRPVFTLNIFESIQTITGYIAQVAMGDAPYGTLEYYSLFAVGLYLLAIVLIMNMIGLVISRRFSMRVSRV